MRTFLITLLVAVASPLCIAQTAPTAPTKPISFDLTAIDKTADPCTDFFQYACGNWVKNNPIPADQVRWGRFQELGDYNLYLLYTELEHAAAAPKTPLEKKYGDFYAACMNTTEVDALGTKPLQPELAAIAAIPSKKQLAAFDAKEDARGLGAFFRISVTQDQKDSTQQIAATGQGGLSLPDRDYYLNDTPRFRKIRDQFMDHMVTMFQLIGDTPDKAKTEAADVMRIETALAAGSMDRVELRDPDKSYHMLSVGELQKLTPEFDWTAYLDGIHLSQAKVVDVSSLKYAAAANDVIKNESLDAIKSYMRFHAVRGAAPWLSKDFEQANFDFFNKTLNGQKEEQPRWKRCTRATDQALGEAVGQDWVKQHFPPAAKDNMEKLVHALEQAMAEDLKTLPWMSDATKVEAKKKLDAMADKIGYPEHWKNYSTLTVERKDLLGNVERAQHFERLRNLAKFGKPVDKMEWGMTPPTVNAYYQPSQNNINFPAGILQPPFYDNAQDSAVNFGAIGVVIGHEMTHGFDDQGAKFDLYGNVKQWWTDEDLAKFKERTECTAKEYDGFEVAPGQNLNGHLTLGENTADNGGLRIAYRALLDTMAKDGGPGAGYTNGEKDGYTPAQRFFIAYGQVWCGNQTPETAVTLAKTDPHSSAKWRVDGVVQNFDEFGKAFGCKKGQPMMPESGGCRTW